jgi:hypothetical protein
MDNAPARLILLPSGNLAHTYMDQIIHIVNKLAMRVSNTCVMIVSWYTIEVPETRGCSDGRNT